MLPEKGSEMLAGLAGAEHAQHQHVAGGAVGSRVWRYDIQNAVPLNGAFPDPLVLADRVAARMPHQIALRRDQARGPDPGWVSHVSGSLQGPLPRRAKG